MREARLPLRQSGAASARLSPRESEVLMLLSRGLTNKAIASGLGISTNTAKFHVASVYRKLGLHSRAGAAGQWTRWTQRGSPPPD